MRFKKKKIDETQTVGRRLSKCVNGTTQNCFRSAMFYEMIDLSCRKKLSTEQWLLGEFVSFIVTREENRNLKGEK